MCYPWKKRGKVIALLYHKGEKVINSSPLSREGRGRRGGEKASSFLSRKKGKKGGCGGRGEGSSN